MAELGIIASVVQIADVGLRLSIKLYTFGEIVASADRSVISISKDVSLTSGVLKELGQILDKDKETRTFSEKAVQTADGVVKECLEVFQEMENILVKKMPGLATGDRDGKGVERAKRAMVMLERLKWGFLQPKLELLRSNLDRLKSTLLLMLNVITYARQVSGKTESPSVIAEQRSLIEELAHSNQDYIRKFERLKLGIDGTTVEKVDGASNIGGGAIEREPGTTTRLLPNVPTRIYVGMKSAVVEDTPVQDKENTRVLGSRELTTATRPLPKTQRSVTESLANPPNADTGNVFINASVRTNIAMPPVQERGIPATEAPMELEQDVLFKQLEHYSMLISNLLKEVDEAQYKITFKSRLRVKGGIAGLHEKERQELERIWGITALQSADQKLESLVEGHGELPRMNRFAGKDPIPMSSHVDMRRIGIFPTMASNREPDNRKQEEAVVWLPQATPDGRLFSLNSVTGAPLMENPSHWPNSVNEAAAKENRIIVVSESTGRGTADTVKPYTGNDSALGSAPHLSNKTLRRKNVKRLALSAAPPPPAPSVGDVQLSRTPERDVEWGRQTGPERLDQTPNLRADRYAEGQSVEKKDDTAPDMLVGRIAPKPRMFDSVSVPSVHSSRQLSSVPPMVAGSSISPSSSPGKPISPHTPQTPAVPSRLSANSTIEYPHRVPSSVAKGGPRPAATDGAQDARGDQDSSTGAIDIPNSPRPFHPNYRPSSSASLSVDDRLISLDAEGIEAETNVPKKHDDSRFSSPRPSNELEDEKPLLFAKSRIDFARSQVDITQQPHRNLEEHRGEERGGSDLGAGAFGYVPIPVTSVNDSPYMAHSTEISQLAKKSSFRDGPDRWRFSFDSNAEETKTDVVSYSVGPSLSSTYVAPDVSRNDFRNDFSVAQTSLAQTFQSIERGRHSYNPQPEVIVEDPNDTVAFKRARNTIAARKSRAKKMERTEELVSQVTQLEAEAEHWKSIALSLGQRDGDSEVGDTKSRHKREGTGERGKKTAVVNNFSAHDGNTTLSHQDAPTQPRVLPVTGASQGPSAGEQNRTAMRQGTNSATRDKLVLQQQDTVKPGSNGLDEVADESYPMPFNSDLDNSDILETFDFEKFLQTTDGDFNFDPSTFEKADGIEIARFHSSFDYKQGKEEEEEEEEKVDLSVLKGLTVNEQGNVVGPKGVPIARLVEGNVKELVGKECDGEGQLWNDSGKIVGCCELIPESEREAKSEGPFVGLEGCVVGKDAFVEDGDRNRVGVVVEGDTKQLIGCAVDEDGDIIDKYGNIKGHAEPYEEPEEEVVDLSSLEGKIVNKAGNVVDEHGTIFGRIAEGDPAELVGKKVDGQGQIWNDNGKVIGQAELLPGGGTQAPEGPFTGFENLVMADRGVVTDSRIAESLIHGRMLFLDDMYDTYASETGKAESWQRESEQGDSRPRDMEVVDRLISLWTTVKPM